MRQSSENRKTSETDVFVAVNIDGVGDKKINSGCGFLDHMLTLFAKHASFDLEVQCKGDTYVDYHHSVEDIGIVLGSVIRKCLGDCAGIARYGSIILPMDETLVLCSVDVSGRSYLSYNLPIPTQKVGDFDTELVNEFFSAFTRSSGMTIHIKLMDGYNSHHIIEGAFKAFARALSAAVKVNGTAIPSTKGII